MMKGVSYDEALAEADRVERRERRRAGDVRKATHKGKELPDASAAHERNRMAEGLPYSGEHAESSRIEFRCRHHPDELHDVLSSEGWA